MTDTCNPVVAHAAMDADRPVRRRVLRGILEQVRQCHRRQARIDLHLQLRVGIHAQVASLQRVPHVRHRGIDHIGRGHPLAVDADRRGVDARHVEDVLEQARQAIQLADSAALHLLAARIAGRQILPAGFQRPT